MKNLDYNRCLQVIKWNIIANKKQLINGTIAMAAAIVVLAFLKTGMLWTRGDIDLSGISRTANIIITMSLIYLLVSASYINFNMQKKGDIINYAMLPATKLEKFCANWVMKVPVALIMLIVAILAGDIVQILICFLLHGKAASMTISLIAGNSFFGFLGSQPIAFSYRGILFIEWILGTILFHATFLYGGVFFRKYAALFTVLCWIAFPMVIGALITAITAAIGWFFIDTSYDVTIEWLVSPDTIKVIVTICGILIQIATIALLYWLTYRKFCKIQVINNRFYN